MTILKSFELCSDNMWGCAECFMATSYMSLGPQGPAFATLHHTPQSSLSMAQQLQCHLSRVHSHQDAWHCQPPHLKPPPGILAIISSPALVIVTFWARWNIRALIM
ncbi:rCG40843, isoform CRA_b [Rattus norvegicus]|uniref:RCG40843, isoform CRA_b n=1 Tax=Rattus norvegicus TaxID=10116 RepID=A6KL07_RAT|nr:rCG40843, isoform CRA_b [Rattus norvegicus]